MKKTFLISAIAICGMVSAQQNSIKIAPFSLFGGAFGGVNMLSYERAINEKSSLGLGAGYVGYSTEEVKYRHGGASLFYRYYFSQVLKGGYASGTASYGLGKVENKDYYSNTTEDNYGILGIGFRAGYQWVWNSGFTLDLNGGLNYTFFNYKTRTENTNVDDLKANILLPTIGIALGYSF